MHAPWTRTVVSEGQGKERQEWMKMGKWRGVGGDICNNVNFKNF